MKTTLLTLFIFSLVFSGDYLLNAQCDNLSSYNSAGIYPSVLPEACNSKAYSETVVVVAPEDTSYLQFNGTISEVNVTGVNNLPTGLTYDCGDCTFTPDNDGLIRACLAISGTVSDPTYNTQNITINVTASGVLEGIPFNNSPQSYDVAFTVNDCVTSLEESISTNSVQIYPMPLNSNSVIELDLNSKNTVSTEVYNVIGKKVVSLSPKLYSSGSHKLNIGDKLSSFQPGIYIVKINIGERAITKRVILN